MATPKKPTTPIKAANPYRTPEGKLTKRGRISLQQAGGAFEQAPQGETKITPVKAERVPQTKMEALDAAGRLAVQGAKKRFVAGHVEKVKQVYDTAEIGGHFDAAGAASAAGELFDRTKANTVRFGARRIQAERMWPADQRTHEQRTADRQAAAEDLQRRTEAGHAERERSWNLVAKNGLAIAGKRLVDSSTGETVGHMKPFINGPGVWKGDPAQVTRQHEEAQKAAFATPEGQAWLKRNAAAPVAKTASDSSDSGANIDRIPTYKFIGEADGNGLDLPKEWTKGAPTGAWEGTEGEAKVQAAKEARKSDPVAIVDDRAARKAQAAANKTKKAEDAKGGFESLPGRGGLKGKRVYRNK
jgi:hypothetical protein